MSDTTVGTRTTVAWISGASSGIGAALARSVPYDGARVLGISRRPPVVGEHVAADLADVDSWDRVALSFEGVLAETRPNVPSCCTSPATVPRTDRSPRPTPTRTPAA